MKKYREWSPTPLDSRGICLPNRQDWLVLPVIQNRDSGVLEKSNFQVALEELGGESETVEVHRFGHWGPGWFEIILVDPESPARLVADDIEASLADYPILNEDRFSAMEWQAAQDYWDSMRLRDRIEMCAKHGFSIFSARSASIPSDDDGSLFYDLVADL